jgi:hypothetical protein
MLLHVMFQLAGAVLAQLIRYLMVNKWYSWFGPGAVMPNQDMSLEKVNSLSLLLIKWK